MISPKDIIRIKYL